MTLVAKVMQLLRAGAAGIAATAVDLLTLALCVSALHVDARVASIPALVAGGITNFLGNRHFAFRAGAGNVAKQAVGYTVVELVALALNGILYDTVLRVVPNAAHVYWAVRLVTSHVVFLAWSYPLWRRVFAVRTPA
jgi:putative flippase GtrA